MKYTNFPRFPSVFSIGRLSGRVNEGRGSSQKGSNLLAHSSLLESDIVMSAKKLGILLVLLFSVATEATEWDEKDQLTPAELNELIGIERGPVEKSRLPGIEQAIGFFSRGDLINSNSLPSESQGILKIMQGRNRSYATDDLVKILADIAKSISLDFPNGERLQIGDISGAGGGPLGRHGSHQNGLDVDIAYYRHNHKEQNPDNNLGFDEDFVPRGKLSLNFDSDRNGEVFSRLIQTGRVNRIFVDEVIKKHFCLKWKNQDSDQKVAAVLRSLRPLKNHHDHFHLRLTCPPTSPRCIEQEPPPVGTGC